MAYIITTQSHGGRTWYMLRNGNRTTDRGRAWRYSTRIAAANALVRQCLRVEIDSAWHHASVTSDEPPHVASSRTGLLDSPGG